MAASATARITAIAIAALRPVDRPEEEEEVLSVVEAPVELVEDELPVVLLKVDCVFVLPLITIKLVDILLSAEDIEAGKLSSDVLAVAGAPALLV